jgi:hypothetical protein
MVEGVEIEWEVTADESPAKEQGVERRECKKIDSFPFKGKVRWGMGVTHSRRPSFSPSFI